PCFAAERASSGLCAPAGKSGRSPAAGASVTRAELFKQQNSTETKDRYDTQHAQKHIASPRENVAGVHHIGGGTFDGRHHLLGAKNCPGAKRNSAGGRERSVRRRSVRRRSGGRDRFSRLRARRSRFRL